MIQVMMILIAVAQTVTLLNHLMKKIIASWYFKSFVLCVFLFSTTFSPVLSKIQCHSLFGLAEEMTSSVEI